MVSRGKGKNNNERKMERESEIKGKMEGKGNRKGKGKGTKTNKRAQICKKKQSIKIFFLSLSFFMYLLLEKDPLHNPVKNQC